jgi:anti-anti-sigma factor
MNSDAAVFSARVERSGSACRVVVQDEVDTATAPGLTDAVATAIVDAPADLVFDLANTTFLDSAGLRIMAASRRHCPKPAGWSYDDQDRSSARC